MAARQRREPVRTCPRCHVPNAPQRDYCYNCGAELTDDPPPPASILRVPLQLEIVVLVIGIGAAVGIAVAVVLLRSA